MNALEKLNIHDQRKAELDAAYMEQTECRREIEKTNRDLREAESQLALFKRQRSNCDHNGKFYPEALTELSRERYEKLQGEVNRLNDHLAELDRQVPEIKARIEAALEDAGKPVTITGKEVIAQQEVVIQARAEVAKIREAIEDQENLIETTLREIDNTQNETRQVAEDQLAKKALGEIDDTAAVEGVDRMAASSFNKHRGEVDTIDATITGLSRRLEQAEDILEVETSKLLSLMQLHMEALFQKKREAYEKAAHEAFKALGEAWGFDRVLKKLGQPAGANISGIMMAPKLRGSEARGLLIEGIPDLDHASDVVNEMLDKEGIDLTLI